MTQMSYTETLIVTSCYCGIPFAIPENLYGWMQKKSANGCYCPNGHKMHFSNTLETQLEEARESARRAREREGATRSLLDHEERSHAATKGHLTRAKKQVHHAEHGVCPHCRRHFSDLEAHVKTKHPEVLT